MEGLRTREDPISCTAANKALESLFLAFDAPPEAHEFGRKALDALADSSINFARKRNTPPHITIKAPFAVRSDHMPAIIDQVRVLVEDRSVARFAVELDDIREFDNGAVHHAVGGTSVLCAMNRIIGPLGLLGCRRGVFEGQTPHITIAKMRNGSRCGRGLEFVRSLGPPKGRYQIERLVMYHRMPDAHDWTSKEELVLR